MRRTTAAAAALLFALAACGHDVDAASRGDRTADDDPPAATFRDADAQLRKAVQGYSDAFLSGDGDAAFKAMSSRCRTRTGRQMMRQLAALATQQYDPAPIAKYSVLISDPLARVTYSYDDYPELKQDQEPWVFEDGAWRNDDC